MPRLPGLCADCGAIYPSPLQAAASGEEPAFEVPVPCPVCGGSGRVPPGVLHRLSVLLETADRLAADGPARERLAGLLRDVAVPVGGESGKEEEDVLRARLRARTASLAPEGEDLGVAEALPGFREGEVEAFLRLFRISVRLVEAADGPEDPGAEAADGVARLLEEAYRRHGPDRSEAEDEEADPTTRARRRLARAGRNDPCPCGSEEKYKRCHWMDDLRRSR